MSINKIDLTGQTFTRLLVLSEAERGKDGQIYWNCICDCGNTKKVRSDHLRNRSIASCGCLKKETTAIIGKTTIGSLLHGDSRTYLYTTWCGIKGRCFNKNRSRYNDWGGRGITMNEQWKNSYPEFKEYVIKNLGERPKGYSIDRINNDGNYEPGNIRWSMPHEQQNNRRKQKLI